MKKFLIYAESAVYAKYMDKDSEDPYLFKRGNHPLGVYEAKNEDQAVAMAINESKHGYYMIGHRIRL